jgi:hypothetical protein
MFMLSYLRKKENVIKLEFDEKGDTDEGELLQEEREHDGTAEQEEQTPAQCKL